MTIGGSPSTTTETWPGVWPGVDTRGRRRRAVAAAANAPVGSGREVERLHAQPRRPVVGEVAAEAAAQAGGGALLAGGHEHAGVREVVQAVGVVVVQMREHDRAHGSRIEAQALELRPDLVLGRDPEAHAEAVVRMPARQVAGLADPRALAGVDDDRPVGMLDDPGEDRQPVRPLAVAQGVEPPPGPARHRLDLAALDPHQAGLDGVDLHPLRRPSGLRRSRGRSP